MVDTHSLQPVMTEYHKIYKVMRDNIIVTHLDETSHMSAEFVFRYGPKCMRGLILPIHVLLHL